MLLERLFKEKSLKERFIEDIKYGVDRILLVGIRNKIAYRQLKSERKITEEELKSTIEEGILKYAVNEYYSATTLGTEIRNPEYITFAASKGIITDFELTKLCIYDSKGFFSKHYNPKIIEDHLKELYLGLGNERL